MESKSRRMGDVLVELGLIDEHRLNHALDVAAKEGLRMGEALILLGYLTEDQVLGILKNLIDIPVLDMFTDEVTKEAQTLLPADRMRELHAIPLEIHDRMVKVAFADPLNYVAVENVKFLLNRDVIPVLASRAQIEDTLDSLEKIGLGTQELPLHGVKRSIHIINMLDSSPVNILRLLNDPENTDLHLSIGTSPAIRSGGVFMRSNIPIFTNETMNRFIREILPDDQLQILKEKKEVEFTYLRPGVGRYRINVYHQRDGELAVAARRLIEDIPSCTSLGLPDQLITLLDKIGFLLVASPGGQGKNVTIASLVDHINSTRNANIITFEDPIEYVHLHKMSNVNQREIGRDTLKDAPDIYENVFKHDPDILVFSNIMDSSMVNTAIRATQKGILVIAGINAMDVFAAVDQILSILQDEYSKALFAHSLLSVFAQRIVGAKPKKGGTLVWEMLVGKPRIQKYIRDNKVFFIKGQAASLQGEYFPMEESLASAIKAGKVDRRSMELEPNINREMLNSYLDRQ
jgi:twitching motility protein PilT